MIVWTPSTWSSSSASFAVLNSWAEKERRRRRSKHEIASFRAMNRMKERFTHMWLWENEGSYPQDSNVKFRKWNVSRRIIILFLISLKKKEKEKCILIWFSLFSDTLHHIVLHHHHVWRLYHHVIFCLRIPFSPSVSFCHTSWMWSYFMHADSSPPPPLNTHLDGETCGHHQESCERTFFPFLFLLSSGSSSFRRWFSWSLMVVFHILPSFLGFFQTSFEPPKGTSTSFSLFLSSFYFIFPEMMVIIIVLMVVLMITIIIHIRTMWKSRNGSAVHAPQCYVWG